MSKTNIVTNPTNKIQIHNAVICVKIEPSQNILVQHFLIPHTLSTRYLRHRRVVVSQQCHRIASFLRLVLSQISGTVFHCYLGNAVLVLPLDIEHLIPDDDSVRLLSQFIERMF